MAAQRTTDPGVVTMEDVYRVIDHNADELDSAFRAAEVTANGTLTFTRVSGDTEAVDIPLAPDGIYSGLIATVAGLTVSITEGVVQRNGIHYEVAAATLELSPNQTAEDRFDLIYYDTASETSAIRVDEGISGLTPGVLAGRLPLWLASVPAGEDGTQGGVALAPFNRMAGDGQMLPAGAQPNDILAARPVAGGGTFWDIAGKTETVDADEFAVQWHHHKGTIYVRSSGAYYSGLTALTFPEGLFKGWHVRLVDVATLTGAEDGAALLIEGRGEAPALVNGLGSFELEPGWIGAEVHFDGEQFLVLPASISL